jgi:hypothetical protein
MSDLFSEALHDERSFFLVLFGAKFFLWHPVGSPMWYMRSSSGDCPLEAGVELEWFPAKLPRIWLYAGLLACARTDRASVSSGGRDTFDSDSMLVTPWLAHLGVHPWFTAHVGGPPPFLVSSLFLYFGCFSAHRLHVSHSGVLYCFHGCAADVLCVFIMKGQETSFIATMSQCLLNIY